MRHKKFQINTLSAKKVVIYSNEGVSIFTYKTITHPISFCKNAPVNNVLKCLPGSVPSGLLNSILCDIRITILHLLFTGAWYIFTNSLIFSFLITFSWGGEGWVSWKQHKVLLSEPTWKSLNRWLSLFMFIDMTHAWYQLCHVIFC